MADEFCDALERFRDWFAGFSRSYEQLRTEVFIHDDAPLRLKQLWSTLGWAPGIGNRLLSLRPERVVTHRAAQRTFKAWASEPKVAQALGVSSARDIWARMPPQPWFLYVNSWEAMRQVGSAYLVDEKAGDNPALLMTSGGSPSTHKPNAVQYTLRATVYIHGHHRSLSTRKLEAPHCPGLFDPVLPGFWKLMDGVWGLSPGETENETTIGTILYERAENLIDYLVSLGDKLPLIGIPCFHYEGLFSLKDLKTLRPEKLAARGFAVLEPEKERARFDGPSAVGRLDGLPFIVAAHAGGPSGFVYVPMEHVAAFRVLMKKEKLSSYDTQLSPPIPPSAADRDRVKKLHQAAEKLFRESGKSARPKKTVAACKTHQTPLEQEATLLRELLLRSRPELELEPPALSKDDPVSIRSLWASLGWSEELSVLIGWPDRASSAEELRTVMQDYGGWGSPLKRAKLPKRLRLVQVDDQGVGVTVTDETGDADDPPVVFASSDTGEVSTVSPSYLRWVGEALLTHTLEALPGFEVKADASVFAEGIQGMPSLAPNLRRLSPKVYVAPVPHLKGHWRIAATELGALVDYLVGASGNWSLADVDSMKGAACVDVPHFAPIAPLVRLHQGRALFAGRIDSLPVVVAGTTLYAALDNLKQVTEIVRRHNWR